MELSNLENNIQNKLEKRRINPSDNAWNKLETKLDGEENSSKKNYWWIAMAASFLVGFLISWVIFFNQGTPKKSYLVSNHQTKTNITTKPSSKRKKKKPQPSVKKLSNSHKSNIITEKKDTKAITKPTKPDKVKTKSKEVNPKQDELKPTKPNSKVEIKIKNKPKEPADLKTAIAGNFERSNDNNRTDKVTDAEIEKLLHHAQLKIRAEASPQKYQNTVSASALLQEVEAGKDKPLKDQILKTIKDGFQKFKGLLASRE